MMNTKLLCRLAGLALALGLPVPQGQAITTSGALASNETWSGTITLTGDVTVPANLTLTIEPGTRIQCWAKADDRNGGANNTRVELIVSGGTLNAIGTESNYITFTAHTNALPVSAGDWRGVRLLVAAATNLSTLRYCKVEYAYDGLSLENGKAAVDHCLFQNNQRYGVYGLVTNRLADCVLQRNSNGVGSATAPLSLVNCVITNNNGHGINGGSANLSVTNCLIIGNAGCGMRTDLGKAIIAQACMIVGNGAYGIAGGAFNDIGSLVVLNSQVCSNGNTGIYSNPSYGPGNLGTLVSNTFCLGNRGHGLEAPNASVFDSVLNGNTDTGLFCHYSATVGRCDASFNQTGINCGELLTLTNCIVARNQQQGLWLAYMVDGILAANVAGNQIVANGVGLRIEAFDATGLRIISNNISGNNVYEITNSSPVGVVVVAEADYWGEPTTTELVQRAENLTRIYDHVDNPALGAVVLTNWLAGNPHPYPPEILGSPQDQTVSVGDSARFEVQTTNAAHWPAACQWLRDGTALPGATNTLLTLTNVTMGDSGTQYAAIVRNPDGAVTTAWARLTVQAPPAITSQPSDVAVLAGGTATFQVAATGTLPLSYQWQCNGTNLTDDSRISGALTPDLTITMVQPGDAGLYQVMISNAAGTTNSRVAWLLLVEPPAISQPPASQTVVAGQPAVFTVSATGTEPLAYQWLFEDVAIPDATNTLLTLAQVEENQAGVYAVAVSNLYGVVTSAWVRLTVQVPPAVTSQPLDAAVLAGGAALFQVSAAGTLPLSYQWQCNGTNLTDDSRISGALTPDLTIAMAQPGDAGLYRVMVSNAVGATNSRDARLTVLEPPAISQAPTSQTVVAGQPAVFAVSATGTEPLAYQWLFEGVAIPDATNILLTLPQVEANQAGLYAVAVSNLYGAVTSAWARLTVQVPPVITNQPSDVAVLAGSTATFQVAASGTLPLSYQWQFNGTNLTDDSRISGALTPDLTIAMVQAGDRGLYRVVVSNVVGATNSQDARLTVLEPPTISQPPASQTVVAGQPAVFAVSATGTEPLAYQWLFEGVAIPNATNALLTLPQVEANQAGLYAVAVSNLYGAVTSSAAALGWLSLAAGTQVEFAFVAPVGTSYRIEYNADLSQRTNWQALTNLILPATPYAYVDEGAPLPGRRFYRILHTGPAERVKDSKP